MARLVLVVSTVEHGEDVLHAHVGAADEIKVVVPVVRQGALDWLANDQKAFGHAERVAERTAQELSGETVEAVAGEADDMVYAREGVDGPQQAGHRSAVTFTLADGLGRSSTLLNISWENNA